MYSICVLARTLSCMCRLIFILALVCICVLSLASALFTQVVFHVSDALGLKFDLSCVEKPALCRHTCLADGSNLDTFGI